MTNVVQFGLLGIGLGAIYALMGQGIVLIYRGSGVLNIAQGGFAMFGAYLYLQLHVPGNLGSLTATKGWPVLPSFVVAVAATALIGLATDQLLLRRMRKASPLARLIATVGVLLVLQAGAAKIWGATPPFVPSILPTQIWHVSSSITLPSSYVWLLGIAVAITALLTVDVAVHAYRLGDGGGVAERAWCRRARDLAGVCLVGDVDGGCRAGGGRRDPVLADHAGIDRRDEPARHPGARRGAARRVRFVPGDARQRPARRHCADDRVELQRLLREASAHHAWRRMPFRC